MPEPGYRKPKESSLDTFYGVTAIIPKGVTHHLVALGVYEKSSRARNAGWGFFSAAIGFWVAYATVASWENPLTLTACIALTVLAVRNFASALIADAEIAQDVTEVDAARLFAAAENCVVHRNAGEGEQSLRWHVRVRLWLGRRCGGVF